MGATLVKFGVASIVAVAAAIALQNVCFTRIEAGKAAAVWDMDGSVEVVDGPRLAWTVRKRVEFLPRYTAQPKGEPDGPLLHCERVARHVVT